jgi:spermidine synthase
LTDSSRARTLSDSHPILPRQVDVKVRTPFVAAHGGAIIVLLFASGCAALVYEVAWFQLLQIAVGSSAISLGILLAIFMGGMCAGSLLAPHLGSGWNPLRLFALLELAVGSCGLLSIYLVGIVGFLARRMSLDNSSLSVIVACLPLVVPTMAMGAALPVLARCISTPRQRASWPGLLYAGNLAGAVAGALLAGFYLLRLFDTNHAIGTAAAIDLATAVGAWGIASRFRPASENSLATAAASDPVGSMNVYVAIGLSGVTALSAELLWTRLLSLSFGATVYAFSLIAAAFLIGLGVGSGVAPMLGRENNKHSRLLLGWCQILICAAVAWSAYLLSQAIPYWPVQPGAAANPWPAFRQDFLRSLMVVLPGAALWGASFPFAVTSLSASAHHASRTIARIYAANTAGAIIGSLGTILLLAKHVGTQRLEQSLIVLAAASGLTALASAPKAADSKSFKVRFAWMEWVAVALAAAVLVSDISPVPPVLIAYGRHSAAWLATSKVADTGSILYSGEGLNDFIAVSRSGAGELNFHASGKVQASTATQDMRLQLLLGHLSHLVPPHPRSALVVGCGAGITAGALLIGPGVEKITIAELEPLVPKVASQYFGDSNHGVIQDSRVTVRIEDGRRYLSTTDEKFDIITTDLVDPWVRGVAALFTREFFDLAKQHLRPGGVVTQFVQLYGMSPEAVKSEIGTFVDAFPNTLIWGNPRDGEGYDLVMLGEVEPVRIDVDQLQTLLGTPPYAPVAASLHSVGIDSGIDLLSTYAASGADLKPWLAGAAINHDSDLRLQYLAGLGMDREENGPIYREMLRYATFPQTTFTGSRSSVEQLRQRIAEELNKAAK